jgi:hypothetical protein
VVLVGAVDQLGSAPSAVGVLPVKKFTACSARAEVSAE